MRNSPGPIVFALADTRVVRLLKLVTTFYSMVRGWSLAATRCVWAFHSSAFSARGLGNNHLDDAWGIRNFESMNTGKLRIGNNWNAITIIALSQNNPMKAIAEFVENSIDAGAKIVTVVRGRERASTTSRSSTTAPGSRSMRRGPLTSNMSRLTSATPSRKS